MYACKYSWEYVVEGFFFSGTPHISYCKLPSIMRENINLLDIKILFKLLKQNKHNFFQKKSS